MMECYICLLFFLLTQILGQNKSHCLVSSPSGENAASNITDGETLKRRLPTSIQNSLQGMDFSIMNILLYRISYDFFSHQFHALYEAFLGFVEESIRYM